jgi:hypothetical protein
MLARDQCLCIALRNVLVEILRSDPFSAGSFIVDITVLFFICLLLVFDLLCLVRIVSFFRVISSISLVFKRWERFFEGFLHLFLLVVLCLFLGTLLCPLGLSVLCNFIPAIIGRLFVL